MCDSWEPFEPWWIRDNREGRGSLTRTLFGLVLLGALPTALFVGIVVGALS